MDTARNMQQWGEKQPLRLFETCLDYIAANVRHVQSFQGFPELIAEEIFHRWLANTSPSWPKANPIQKMTEAYKSLILRCLCLKNCRILIDTYTPSFWLHFQFIEELDISHCKLGDDHQMLTYISQLKRQVQQQAAETQSCFIEILYQSLDCHQQLALTHLSLKDNYISDAGIMKWTIGRRFSSENFQDLVCLDLSCNLRVTDHCIRYLLAIKSLCDLNISNTSISPIGLKQLQDMANFRQHGSLSNNILEYDFDNFTETSGWIANWIEEMKALCWKKHGDVNIPKLIKSRLGDCILKKYQGDSQSEGLQVNPLKSDKKSNGDLSTTRETQKTEDFDRQLLQLYS
ncbi:Leucine-rich repeat-containing protein 42 [Trichoplax sp. H2]|nr:Leucine-rich repeat-containing protein 42 [Trichoplax sp. H2]|eukprot:RDD40217.1 Leucine-rich repeat-containing protein 42 [Trichoplax sp. H2]